LTPTLIAPDGALAIAGARLGQAAGSVLWWAVAELDTTAWLSFGQRHIATATGLSQTAVSGGLATLVALDFLEKDRRREAIVYRLSSSIAWALPLDPTPTADAAAPPDEIASARDELAAKIEQIASRQTRTDQ